MRLGRCGETGERAAARAHLVVGTLSAVAAAAALGAAVVEAILVAWHAASAREHRRRATEEDA